VEANEGAIADEGVVDLERRVRATADQDGLDELVGEVHDEAVHPMVGSEDLRWQEPVVCRLFAGQVPQRRQILRKVDIRRRRATFSLRLDGEEGLKGVARPSRLLRQARDPLDLGPVDDVAVAPGDDEWTN
jgi:hypothetical protein